MLKQTGITVLELLIGLGIMSGVSLYTMKMTEEVEDAVIVYQDSVQDMGAIREKLKLAKQQSNDIEEYEVLQASMGELDRALNFED